MLLCTCPAANAVPRHVACGPAPSPPVLGTCEQSWEELAHPLLSLACVLGRQRLEIKAASSSTELWVGACWVHSLHSVTGGSSWGSAASPSALTQLESKLAAPERDRLWSRALGKKYGAGSAMELAEDKPSR